MGRPKIHDISTADALLVAAERIVESDGVDALTVRRLATDVGTTTRAVYSTFGGKDALLAALGIRAFEVLDDRVRRVSFTDDPARDLVQVGTAAFREFTRRHTGLFRIGFDVDATAPQIWFHVQPVNERAWNSLLERIERLGLTHPKENLAMQFHALCEGLAVNELRGNLGSRRNATAVWHDALTALISGWTPRGSASMANDVVQRQVDAYNRRDLDVFMACYAPAAVIQWADGSQRLSGHEAIRARYAELFARAPNLNAEILGRLRAGEWTVDEERVRAETAELHVLVGYRIRDNLIDLVVMMRSD
jgi:hypothetical protein